MQREYERKKKSNTYLLLNIKTNEEEMELCLPQLARLTRQANLGRWRRRQALDTSHPHLIFTNLCQSQTLDISNNIRVEVVRTLDLIQELRRGSTNRHLTTWPSALCEDRLS